MNWQNIVLVLLGSGLGGTIRYLISHFHAQWSGDVSKHFVPIFIVNIIGSFLIGLAFAFLLRQNINQKMSLLLITGFLGGFTTYSSFSLDILRLIDRGELITAAIYLISSISVGLVAVFFGYWVGNW